MTHVTHFEPPEGLYAHEASLFLPSVEKDWSTRAIMTCFLELADNGTLTFSLGDKRPTRHAPAGVTLTPLQERIAGFLEGSVQGFQNENAWRKLVWTRLAERGWCDASGRLTPAGEEVKRQLYGYREYLRTAMTDRTHVAAVEGRIDRDVEFAAGLGIINMPNINRAIMTRLGVPLDGFSGAVFDMLGGKPSEQHAVSYRKPMQGLRTCCLAVTVLVVIFWTLIAVLAIRNGGSFEYHWSSSSRSSQ